MAKVEEEIGRYGPNEEKYIQPLLGTRPFILLEYEIGDNYLPKVAITFGGGIREGDLLEGLELTVESIKAKELVLAALPPEEKMLEEETDGRSTLFIEHPAAQGESVRPDDGADDQS